MQFKSNIFLNFIFVIIIFALAAVFYSPSISAQSSKDAIAIRVIPNASHMSALVWYEKSGFSGSPQSIIVDGYEGVRDGRTVYVNVANVVSENLYTNIYLISYNQEAEPPTVDIFGNILAHWVFNTNLPVLGHCREENSLRCLKDDECPIGDFCDSKKARTIRDVRRVADLREAKNSAEAYKDSHGFYPKLDAGTYLKNRSLSVWPSWLERFSGEISRALPLDPVNKLGDCSPASGYALGFNEVTCWNESTKSFAMTFPDLPDDSLAYTYETNDGTTAVFCGVFESGLTIAYDPPCILSSVCLDFDDDGWGVFDNPVCDESGTDCDDTDPDVHADGTEICGDSLDNDCDGLIDCDDSDCSCGVCVPDGCGNGCPPGCSVAEDPDCGCAGDAWSCCPAGCANPPDTDCAVICADNTCNGICGPGCTIAEDPDCGCLTGNICCGVTGCNFASDNECAPDCHDDDGDGHNEITALCPGGTDCDDGNPLRYFGNGEACDGIDNDCDTIVDNGWITATCQFLCTNGGYLWAGNGGLLDCCGDNANEIPPALIEETVAQCNDGNDNDCDGDVDWDDSGCSGLCSNAIDREDDHVGPAPGCDQCSEPGDQSGNQEPNSSGSGWLDVYPSSTGLADQCDTSCNTLLAATVHLNDYEPTETRCDGIDNNCNNTIDEGLTGTYYLDVDNDGFGDTSVSADFCPASVPANYRSAGGDCDDRPYGEDGISGNADDGENKYPGGTEICGDGIDQDCSGSDELCPPCTDADGDHWYVESNFCSHLPGFLGYNDCYDSGSGARYVNPGSAETCDNLDNDCSDSDHTNGINPGDIDNGCDDDNDGYCDYMMDIFYNNSTGAGIDTCGFTLVDSSAGARTATNDCNDGAGGGAINPGATELCDGIDNDCNSATLDGSGDPSTPMHPGDPNGICQGVAQVCSGGWNVVDPSGYESPETSCTDGLDNDCDGDTDDDDPDCVRCCSFIIEFDCEFCF